MCAYQLYPLVRIASYRTLLGGVSAWLLYRLVSVLYRLVSGVRITVVGYGVIRCDTERGECSDILIVPGMWVDFLKVPGRCDTCVIRTDTGVSHVSAVS